MAATLGIATLETEVDLDGLDKGLKQSKKSTDGFLKQAKTGFARQFGFSAADAAMKAAKAIKQFADESIQEFQDFERGMSEVFTLIPSASEAAMESMKADVLDFSREAGRTTDETIPALYQAISAGVPSENVFDFMKVASDAALGGVTDLETAVDGITSVTNAYGTEVISAAEASDVMFTAVKLGKTDFEQLSSSLFNVIPTASSLGVSFADVAANLAAMTAQGVPTSVATTQLRAAFVEASKSGTKLDQAIRDLTGQGFGDLIKEGKSSSEIFKILRSSMPEQEFKDLFGSVEASNAALLITSNTADGIIDSFGTVEDTMGATAAAAAEMASTMEHLEARADAATEAYKIQVGEGLNPLKRAYLETKIAALDTLTVHAALRNAVDAGTIGMGELHAQEQKMLFTSYDAADAMAWLESQTVQYADAAQLAAMATETTSYDQKFLGTTVEETAVAVEELNETTVAGAGAADMYAEATQLTAIQSGRAADQFVHKRDKAIELAEAERIAAEAAAEHAAQLGGYFDSALQAGEQTESLEMQLYNAATASGAGAVELSILAAATGDFSDAEIEAAFQAALMRENIEQLATAVANGSLTADEAVDALNRLKDSEVTTAAEAINLAGAASQAQGDLDGISGAAYDARDALSSIPTNIQIDITTNYATTGNPNAGTEDYDPYDTSGQYQMGGWTGHGRDDEIAGVVHRNELVIPGQVVRGGPAEIMDFAQQNTPGGVSSGAGQGGTRVTLINPQFHGVHDVPNFLEQMESIS